jgi:hypothetical protein
VCVKSSGRRRRNPLGLGLKSVRKFTHTHIPSLSHSRSEIKRSELPKDKSSSSSSIRHLSEKSNKKEATCFVTLLLSPFFASFLGGVAFPDEKKKVIVNCKEREKVHEKTHLVKLKK